jgi:hypothetical protein
MKQNKDKDIEFLADNFHFHSEGFIGNFVDTIFCPICRFRRKYRNDNLFKQLFEKQ